MTTTAVSVGYPALRLRQPPLGRLVRMARAKPLGAVSFVILVAIIAMALGAERIAPYDPELTIDGVKRLSSPSSQHWLGTDQFARDVLSRVIFGARVSLTVGLASVALGTAVGSLFGLVSGFLGGRVDLLIQRAMDGMLALPTIVLALVIVAALGTGLTNIIVAIGIAQVPRINRVVRGSVLAEKQNVYVEAARVVGCGDRRIMARHILPNVTAPIIVMATITIANCILTEAGLSFLGVGVPENVPSWGVMLSGEAIKFMLAQPLLAIWPGIAITVTVLAWNLFGDTVRDLGDPRLRGSQ